MDRTLRARLRSGIKPFDGQTIESHVFTVTVLRPLVRTAAAALLSLVRPDFIVTCEDWFEHDAFTTERKQLPPQALLDSLASDATFRRWSADDSFVRRAWYPDDCSFLLRWCLATDPDDFGVQSDVPVGVADVSGAQALVGEIAGLDPHRWAPPTRSVEWFEQRRAE